MDKKNICKIEAVSGGSKHYLFGFHDLIAWNSNNNRLLAIEVEEINIPPNSKLKYPLGYINNENKFFQFGETSTFNYPQGARQQWIGGTNKVIVNDLYKGKVISKVYDTDTCELVDTLNSSTHVVTSEGWAFGIDYARLFRLGAYGYEGAIDKTIGKNTPSDSGIIKHNIYTKKEEVLLSIEEIASFQMKANLGDSHYITHLVLSPDQQRIAFLHRYKLSDGGETTRLCTIGIEGRELRCLATGFLSHFDWQDNNRVMIWGRVGSNIEKLRNSFIYKLVPQSILKTGKNIVKKVLNKSSSKSSAKPSFHWLSILDKKEPQISFVAENIILEDGHPMYCPSNRDWFVCDNYPNNEGDRTLFLYHVPTSKKINLGTFRMINDKPNIEQSASLLKDTDKKFLNIIGLERLAFTRSGLHCDLHPRWNYDGTKVAFDSIHEGSRQIYTIDVTNLIK